MTSRDWFARLTGFAESSYESTQARLAVDGDELISTVSDKRYGIGELSLPTLAQLRERVKIGDDGRTTVRCLVGDSRVLHSDPEFTGALFQVASQFNLLEMVSQNVTPEQGVTRYINDPTQGPACAIAAGAGTIYRNYLVPVGDGVGQTRDRQLDALAGVGAALSELLSRPATELWEMRNGYALCTVEGLRAIAGLLEQASDDQRDGLRGQLAIGLHCNVEVTDVTGDARRSVSQAYCSALPVAYGRSPGASWGPFAQLVLEAAYEATLLSAAEQATAGGSNTVLLTRVGGGAFGNAAEWVDAAIVRALRIVERAGLDVRLVSYGSVDPSMHAIAQRWT